MHTLLLLFFAIAGGLALSGIAANLYRILARRPKSRAERLFYLGVMAVAGPSVLIDNATRSFRGRNCSRGAYAFALGAGLATGDAMRFAAATAALKCMHAGGRAGIPSIRDCLAFMRTNQ